MDKNLLRSQAAKKITLRGFYANAVLTFLKLAAGILGRSQAMVADGVHSLSDFLTDIVVLVGFKLTEKPEDDDHPYGHGKFETVATVGIAVMLFVAGVSIFRSGFQTMLGIFRGEMLSKPGIIAVLAALISIVVKEILFRQTLKVAAEIDSSAVKANAWHHRSDVYSSLGTFVGVGAAAAFGNKWVILDPVASMIVSLFIFKVAFDIFIPSVNELLEAALPQDEMDYIEKVLIDSPDVLAYHEIRARRLSNRVVIEFHMMVEPEMNITEAHDIATQMEKQLYNHFGRDSIITIHIEPYCMREVNYYAEKYR